MDKELKEREAFELQAAMRGLDISMFTPPSEKEYRNPDTQAEWQGWNTRAQLPSQGGEAVEVVASIAVDAEGAVRDFTLEPGLDRHPGGYTVTPLMTVAQHQRILAASVDSGEPTEYQQLSRYGNWDRIDKAVFDLGMLGNCPEKFRALYTHPADQVAQPDAELVACLKFARTTMAVVADNANLRGVEYRSLIAEIKRIDAKLDSLKGAP